MQAVATKLDLQEDLIAYFSLFLIRESVDGGVTCESRHRACIIRQFNNNQLLSEFTDSNGQADLSVICQSLIILSAAVSLIWKCCF